MRRKAIAAASDFNPRSPHGERRDFGNCYSLYYAISTHAPRTGSDGYIMPRHRYGVKFQPTLPARGATYFARRKEGQNCISTHAPRTGSD